MNRLSALLVTVVAVSSRHSAEGTAQDYAPCPAPALTQAGLRLGISVRHYHANTPLGSIDGALVTRDRAGRSLYSRNSNGAWIRYCFRPGYDVVLEVNGAPVGDAEDVLDVLQAGTNSLRVWDKFSGHTRVYYIALGHTWSTPQQPQGPNGSQVMTPSPNPYTYGSGGGVPAGGVPAGEP